ncbi:hypothetical protein PGT21_004801 [Puccinia graminis f. sp. tritici]|uniref:Uncharacterized protein n=1 Tax=Puccinia graminis f. sp. tritici TaxID=56615 RepID=A0A5B0N792_PUCGR|nr:hypothetical protein PGT21_004801 [Puccinia graminis f. sp. tritici]
MRSTFLGCGREAYLSYRRMSLLSITITSALLFSKDPTRDNDSARLRSFLVKTPRDLGGVAYPLSVSRPPVL